MRKIILRNRHHATSSAGSRLRAVAEIDGVETVSRELPMPAAAIDEKHDVFAGGCSFRFVLCFGKER